MIKQIIRVILLAIMIPLAPIYGAIGFPLLGLWFLLRYIFTGKRDLGTAFNLADIILEIPDEILGKK